MGLIEEEDEAEWPTVEAFAEQTSAEYDAFEALAKKVVSTPKGGRKPVIPTMKADHWRMICEFCTVIEDDIPTRQEAIGRGHAHVQEKHADDPEWTFRVQGIKE